MASLVIGSALGYFFGPLGFLAGSAIGALLDPQKGPQISDLHLQGSTYGQVIPLCYGTMRVAGQVIWTTELNPATSKGGKGGPTVTTYSASFDVLICEGPVLGVQRVWADGTLIYDTTGAVTGLPNIPVVFYTGAESQLTDPTEESAIGTGLVPAYRGYCRAVFTNLELANYGNSLPRLTFQVFSEGGSVPWRVSSFTPWSQPSGRAGATFNAGVITIAQPDGASVYVSQWNTNGTQIGSTVISSYGGAQPTTIIGANAWAGIDSHSLYHWYTIDQSALTPIDLGLIDGTGTDPYTSPKNIGGNWPIYLNGYIYTIGDAITAHIVGQYLAPNGIPGNFAGSYSFAGTETIQMLGSSDTNQLYVLTLNTVGNVLKLYRFVAGAGFTIDTSWDHTAIAGTNLANFEGNDFLVYNNLICTQLRAPQAGQLGLTQITGATLASYGQTIPTAGARPQLLYGGTGLGIDTLGVFSLFPPSGPVALSVIVADISDRVGLAADQYDVSALIDEVPGYLVTNQSTGRDNIIELRTAYFFDAVESSGIMRFVKRGGPPIVTIPQNDLAAQVGNTGTPPPLVTVERTQEVDLPATMYVVYIDPTNSYLNGTQYARRLVTNSETVSTVQLAVGLIPSVARQIAQLLLFTSWLERNTLTILVSREYAAYEPTDVIVIEDGSATYQMRITDKTYVATNLIQLKGVIANTNTFIAGPVGAPGEGGGPPTSTTPSPTALLMLNLPLIVDTDFEYGPYAAMAGSSATLKWAGGTLYESTDGGSTYAQIDSSGSPNVIGAATTVLGDFPSGNMFDKLNSVTVVIGAGGGTLASATEGAVLNGANIAYLGGGSGNSGEVFQFANAQLTAPGTYVLSDLLRGRRGTESQIGAHQPGETFLLLPCIDINGPYSDLGKPRLFEALSPGQALAAVPATTFVNTGETLRPYSPCMMYGAPDASGNLTINWTRRTRIGGSWADFTDVPLSEETESYVLQIWDSTFSICARVIGGNQSNPSSGPALITSPTFDYTAAMQIADFGQKQQTVYASVGQLGIFGLGVQAFATLAAGGSSDTSPSNPVTPFNTLPPAPPSGPGCVPSGTLYTYSPTWGTNDVYYSPTLNAGDIVLYKIVVPASPTAQKSSVSGVVWGGADIPGALVAQMSAAPCGPLLMPNLLSVGSDDFYFHFAVGPNPYPQIWPTFQPSTTYYISVTVTEPTPVKFQMITR
jgi:Putative phage tail protein